MPLTREQEAIVASYAHEVIEWMRAEVGTGASDNDLDLRIRLAIRSALSDKKLTGRIRERNAQMRDLLVGYRQDHNESDSDGRCECVLCRDTTALVGKVESA